MPVIRLPRRTFLTGVSQATTVAALARASHAATVASTPAAALRPLPLQPAPQSAPPQPAAPSSAASNVLDLTPIIETALRAVQQAALGPLGAYKRWLAPDRPAVLNAYGSADAANILYTIGHFPEEPAERQAFVATLRSLQHAETGLFQEATHHPFHTTAHCLGALELFDARPSRPLRAMAHLREPVAIVRFLDSLDWKREPGAQSHQGAGAYAALVMAREVSRDWEDAYFDWLSKEADPVTGLWRRGAYSADDPEQTRGIFPHLSGTFHYLFNHEYARRPLPHATALADTCLDIRARNVRPTLGKAVGFAELDWLYCLTRSVRQSGHRFADAKETIQQFAASYVEWLLARVQTEKLPFDDLHALLGVLCTLAELQAALPGRLRTARPLELPLDRRPFV